ncbi:GNAT family N-acetyltransferase [Staphylococcus caeli]|uniref:GNAT family N-acetyltransferase n=1 Tax=Staphylococcus caeli TaxID=2201815 RepID=UPI003F558A17
MTDIRYLTEVDVPAYQALLTQGVHKEIEVMAWKFQTKRSLNQMDLSLLLSKQSPDSITLGAFEDDKLIGAVTLIHNQSYSIAHKVMVENLCVNKDDSLARERVLKLLMQNVFDICQERNIEILLASLISNNISGKVFFSNLNFEMFVIEQHARKYGDNYVDEHWFIYNFNENSNDIFETHE